MFPFTRKNEGEACSRGGGRGARQLIGTCICCGKMYLIYYISAHDWWEVIRFKRSSCYYMYMCYGFDFSCLFSFASHFRYFFWLPLFHLFVAQRLLV